MSLRLFADHCVSSAALEAFRAAGHEVLRLRDVMAHDSPDAHAISKAQELQSVLVSLNGDFADIVTYPPSKFCGIISLQIRNHPEVEQAVIRRLTDFLAVHPAPEYYRGKLLLVEPHRIRIRE